MLGTIKSKATRQRDTSILSVRTEENYRLENESSVGIYMSIRDAQNDL